MTEIPGHQITSDNCVTYGGGKSGSTPRAASVVEGKDADARVLPLQFKGTGGRKTRDWRSASELFNEEPFDDWPQKGPRTVDFCTELLARRNSPLDHHEFWRTTCKLQPEQIGVEEHSHLLELLDLAGRYDALDVTNLACMEHAARRIQTIEWGYADRLKPASSGLGGRIDVDEALAFSGRAGATSAMVSPALLDHVKTVTERDALILKNIRKARDERVERAKAGKKIKGEG